MKKKCMMSLRIIGIFLILTYMLTRLAAADEPLMAGGKDGIQPGSVALPSLDADYGGIPDNVEATRTSPIR